MHRRRDRSAEDPEKRDDKGVEEWGMGRRFPTRGSGERRKFPGGVGGGATAKNDLYCFLGVYAIPSPLLPFLLSEILNTPCVTYSRFENFCADNRCLPWLQLNQLPVGIIRSSIWLLTTCSFSVRRCQSFCIALLSSSCG